MFLQNLVAYGSPCLLPTFYNMGSFTIRLRSFSPLHFPHISSLALFCRSTYVVSRLFNWKEIVQHLLPYKRIDITYQFDILASKEILFFLIHFLFFLKVSFVIPSRLRISLSHFIYFHIDNYLISNSPCLFLQLIVIPFFPLFFTISPKSSCTVPSVSVTNNVCVSHETVITIIIQKIRWFLFLLGSALSPGRQHTQKAYLVT